MCTLKRSFISLNLYACEHFCLVVKKGYIVTSCMSELVFGTSSFFFTQQVHNKNGVEGLQFSILQEQEFVWNSIWPHLKTKAYATVPNSHTWKWGQSKVLPLTQRQQNHFQFSSETCKYQLWGKQTTFVSNISKIKPSNLLWK